MADVDPVQPGGSRNSNVYEFAFDATDKTTAPLPLNPARDTTVAIKTTGSATVSVELYMEDTSNAGAEAFVFESSAATSAGEDWVRSALGPISGAEFTGTVSGGDTATIQVIQSDKRV